jgi:hypothetical protein
MALLVVLADVSSNHGSSYVSWRMFAASMALLMCPGPCFLPGVSCKQGGAGLCAG